MTTILKRQAQVAAAVESVEGTEESLVAADALLIYDLSFSPDVGTFAREPARSTLSKLPSVRGIKLGSLTFRAELKGSGAVGTAPEWDVFLQACGFARSVATAADIGAVTSGPFSAGEPVTFAPSGATGRIVGDVTNGDAQLRAVELTGTIASGDTATGGTSGASATLSSVPAAGGFEYLPASDAVPSATIGAFIDGVKHTLIGCRGTVTIDVNAGEPAFLNFSFQGVYLETVDAALLTPTTYDATIPPVFLGVGFVLGTFAPCFTALGVDVANVLEPRRCANAALGAVSVLITGRSPSASIDPELDLVANYDFFGNLRSGLEGRFACEFGTVAGNVISIASPKVQIDEVGDSDRNGLAVADLTLNLVTSTIDAGDDELQIAAL